MDTNLLRITTTPAAIEINTTPGTLENQKPNPPRMKLKTGEGGNQIDVNPSKINVDTYAARSSMGYGQYNMADFNKVEADKGKQAAFEGVSRIVNEGNSKARGTTASDIALQNLRSKAHIETITTWFPKEGADVSFSEHDVSVDYQMKDVNITWENLQITPLKFNPGSVDINVIEKGSVEIEYVGDPIYVPRSADPNYNPPYNPLEGK